LDYGKETHAPTPESLNPKTAPPKKRRSLGGKRGLQTDTINFEESFAPTPEGYPTPAQHKRDLKKGYKWAPGKETYAPTPESFGKTKRPSMESKKSSKSSNKRGLQTDTINYEESFAPTPENYPTGRKASKSSNKRGLQTDTINYVESFAPTPENYPTSKHQQ